MKIAVFYLLALVISFEALAYDSDEKLTEAYQQKSQFDTPVIKTQTDYAVSWSQTRPANNAEEQVSSEKQEALLTEIIIYALIILAYSIYWQINNNPRD